MNHEQAQDERRYRVVLNAEEQYSIWPIEKPVPAGWRDGGEQGDKNHCLAFIGSVWTDMRPLSLRRQMDQGRVDV